MSLIQVSSSQLAFKNQGIGQGAFNTGFRFSNFFNNVLEIPANAEIALHSAQFDMENTGGLDTTYIGSDNDLDMPCVRIIYSTKSGDFTEQNNDEVLRAANFIPLKLPTASAHQPLVFYINRSKFATMEAFWEDWENNTSRIEPRPLYQYKRTDDGVFTSGYQTNYTAPLGIETETFVATANLMDSAGASVRLLTSSTHANGGGCGFSSPPLSYSQVGAIQQANTCELDDQVGVSTEYRSVIKTGGASLRGAHAPFWTQFEGLHTAGGDFGARGFECPAIVAGSLNPNVGQGRKHIYTMGLKRWGVVTPDSTGVSSRTIGVERLANAAVRIRHSAIAAVAEERWGTGGIPATLPQYYFSAALLSGGADGLSLSADCIADIFWVISPRVTGFTSGGTKVGKYGTEMVVSLWKYEVGKGTGISWADGVDAGRIVCVATGDALVSVQWSVCYSGMLDPSSGFFASPDPAGNHVLNNNAVGLNNGIGLGFKVIGNGVTPIVQAATPLTIQKTPVGYPATAVALKIPISDVCFPLQVCGSMSGRLDKTSFITLNPAGAFNSPALPAVANYQSPVRDLGTGYNEYFSYVRQNQICPASIYNQVFLEQTCEVFYPLDDNVLTPQAVTPYTFYDALVNVLGTTNSVNTSPFIAIGHEPLLDTKPAVGQENANNANISSLIRWNSAIAPTNILSLIPDVRYSASTGSYEIQANGVAPFLLGLYVKLKNLPNRSTFGSLNQADTEKLISVINRYDERQSSAGDKTMYAYNEYDKLYISLNNPSPLFLSKLDFEVVDRFGNPVTALDQTTLVLHLRPAEYKDFYLR